MNQDKHYYALISHSKKHILIVMGVLFATMGFGQVQTQQGYVKTRGRLDSNGNLIPGQGLQGAAVYIKGRSAVSVEANDGAFSFPVPDKYFCVDSVRKSGYQLVDMEFCYKTREYSSTPVDILMENPGQLEAEILDRERKWHRKSEIRFQKLEDSISGLNIGLEEKNRLLNEIGQERVLIEKYIKQLARYYATIDYDRIGAFQKRVDSLMNNCEFKKARQLLYSKGNVEDRLEKIRSEEKAEAQMDAEIQIAIETNNKAKSGTLEERQELAQDCYSYFNSHLLEQCYDSAFYYIELRANIDTTNAEWQYDAGIALDFQFEKQGIYLNRALRLYRELAKSNPNNYEKNIALTLCHLASHYSFGDGMLMQDEILYQKTINTFVGEAFYKEALDIYDRLVKYNPTQYITLYQTLSGLARLYNNLKKYTESIYYWNKSKNALDSIIAYKIDDDYAGSLYGSVYTSLGEIYYTTNRLEDCEKNYKNALSSYVNYFNQCKDKRFAINYLFFVNLTFFDLVELYENTQQYNKVAPVFLEIIELYKEMESYNDNNEEAQNQIGISFCELVSAFDIFISNHEADIEPNILNDLNNGKLEIYKTMYNIYGNSYWYSYGYWLYENDFLKISDKLIDLLCQTGQTSEGIEKAKETVNFFKLLTYGDTDEYYNENYELPLADALNKLGLCAANDSVLVSENAYKEAIEIYRKISKTDEKMAYSLANTLDNLATLYKNVGRFYDSEQLFIEVVSISKSLMITDINSFESRYAQALFDLGSLYFYNMGRFQEAEQLCNEALELYYDLKRTNNLLYDYEIVFCEFMLGNIKIQLGQYTESIPFLEQALAFSETMSDDDFKQQMRIASLPVLGSVYGEVENDFIKAYNIFEELIPMVDAVRQENNEFFLNEYPLVLGSQSYYAILMKRFAKSEQYSRKALELNPIEIKFYINLAASLLFQKRYDEAENIYKQYKNELKDDFLHVLKDFEVAGVIPNECKSDVERIRKLLSE